MPLSDGQQAGIECRDDGEGGLMYCVWITQQTPFVDPVLGEGVTEVVLFNGLWEDRVTAEATLRDWLND